MLIFQIKHFRWFPQYKFYMVTSQVLNNGGQNLEKQSNGMSNTEDLFLQVFFSENSNRLMVRLGFDYIQLFVIQVLSTKRNKV